MPDIAKPIYATFVMEQHIGHYTFYQNLRRFVSSQSGEKGVRPRWVEVSYTHPGSLIQRLHLPGRLLGTWIGRSQVLKGLHTPYDVAFFNTQVPAAITGDEIYKRPYVLCTDITPLQYDAMGPLYGHTPDGTGIISRYKYEVNRKVFQNAARILAWSNWARGSLIKDYGVDPEKIEILPPGVDLNLWKPAGRAQPCFPMRILFVGGDFHRKGGDTLLEAFRRLPPGVAELHLVTRTSLPAEPGVTVYYHMQPNAPALRGLYQSSDVFALPSCAEAFGIATLEAGAAGLPVIATDVGGLSDTIIPGKTGFLIAPRSVNALADHLLWMAEHPNERIQMGRAARTHIEMMFDAQKNAARILDILVEVAETA